MNLAPKMSRKSAALASRCGLLPSGNFRLRRLFRWIAYAILSIQTQLHLWVGRLFFGARSEACSLELDNPKFQICDAIPAPCDCFAKRGAIHLLQIPVAFFARNHKCSMPRCTTYGA